MNSTQQKKDEEKPQGSDPLPQIQNSQREQQKDCGTSTIDNNTACNEDTSDTVHEANDNILDGNQVNTTVQVSGEQDTARDQAGVQRELTSDVKGQVLNEVKGADVNNQEISPEQMENFLRINYAFERFLAANHQNYFLQQQPQDEEKLGAMLYGFFMGYTMSKNEQTYADPNPNNFLPPSTDQTMPMTAPPLPNPFVSFPLQSPPPPHRSVSATLLNHQPPMGPIPPFGFDAPHMHTQQLPPQMFATQQVPPWNPCYDMTRLAPYKRKMSDELMDEGQWDLQGEGRGRGRGKKRVKKGQTNQGSIEDKIVAYIHALAVSRSEVLMLFDKQPWCERQKPETIIRHSQQLQRYLRAEPLWQDQWNEFSVVSKAAVLSRVANNYERLDFILHIRPDKRASMYQLLTRTDKQFLAKFPQFSEWKARKDQTQQAQAQRLVPPPLLRIPNNEHVLHQKDVHPSPL